MSTSRPIRGISALGFACMRFAVRSICAPPQYLASIMGMLLMIRLTENMPIQLNMIDVMTSLTLKSALNSPGKMPQNAPPIIASSRQTYHGSWN